MITLRYTQRYTLRYTLRFTLCYTLRYTLRCTLRYTLRYTILRYASLSFAYIWSGYFSFQHAEAECILPGAFLEYRYMAGGWGRVGGLGGKQIYPD